MRMLLVGKTWYGLKTINGLEKRMKSRIKIIIICLAVSLIASFAAVLIYRSSDDSDWNGIGLYNAGANTEEGWGEIHRP